MRNECINHRFVFDAPMPLGRLVRQIADKAQVCTHRSHKRPYGVGLLVAGIDSKGPHLYQTCPSGNFYDYKAMAMGARSQAAKTYLEKTFASFAGASVDELILHGLRALEASAQEQGIDKKNCTIAIVGKDTPFTLIEDDALEPFLAQIRADEGAGGEGGAAAAEAPVDADGDAQMAD